MGGGVTVSLLVAFIKWLCKFNDMLWVLSKLCQMFLNSNTLQLWYGMGRSETDLLFPTCSMLLFS